MKKYAKQTALALAMALTVTSVAPATASAASAPKYKKEYNAVQKGKSYAYTVKNIKKGTKVKWSLVGTGKKYVSFNKSKAVYSETTKAAKKKTYSTNKIYIRKNTSKVVKVVVKASVTGKNGKKYSVTDKIAIAKTAAKPTATPATTATTAPSTTPSTAPSTTPAATATGAATATPSVAPTATSAATATPSVAPSASTTPSTAPTATASTNPSATPAATATTTPSAAPVVTSGAITVTSNATGASVKVLNGTTVVATGTIANGKAVLPEIANGNYVVEVSAAGFVTATKAVVVNGDVTVDVQLQASKEFTAKQTGVKKIVVTGTDLSDQAADYVVKRDNVTVSIDSVAVSADKTTATLTSVATLRAGDYSIEFKTQKYAFKAEDEKSTKFELIGTNLVLTGNNASTATIGYKVLNQFGERMFDGNPYVACTLGVGTETAKIVVTATATADGKIEVPVDTTKTPISTKGTITLVNRTTGLNLNETVTLSAAATVDTIKVAGIYKDYDTEKATKVDALDTKTDLSKTKYAVLLKAYDQYGNSNASVFTGSSIKITDTGNAGVKPEWSDNVTKAETTTIGGEEYIAIPLKASSNSDLVVGSTIFTIVGIPKGLLGTVEIPVKQAVEVTSLKLVAPVGTAYNGTRTEISYVAKDTNGNEVTDFNTLQNNTTVEWTTGKNSDGQPVSNVHKFEWERQKDGSAKLFFTPNVTFSSTAGERDTQTTVLTTKIGNSIDVTNFTVYNTKKAKAIVGIDKTATKATVASTGSITLKAEDFRFQDQYGNELTDDEVDALAVKPVVAVKIIDNKKSGFASIKVNGSELKGADEASDKKANTETVVVNGKATEIFTATAKDVKAGKTKLEFALQEVSDGTLKNVTGSEFTDTIQSVEINDISEFEIAELGQLYVKGIAAKDEKGNDITKVVSGNAVELKVTGKLGATTVALSPDDYKIINTAFELNADKKVGFKADKLITDDKGNKTSKKETLEIVIGNNAGTSVKKEVTVSSVDPKATTVALNKDVTKKFELSRKKKTEIKVSDIRALLEVKDQYGNKSEDVARYKFETSNLPDGFKVTANNTDSATLELPDKVTTQTIGVTVTFGSGASYTDTLIINVTAE